MRGQPVPSRRAAAGSVASGRGAAALLAAALALAGCAAEGPLGPLADTAAVQPRADETWYRLGIRLLAASEPAAAERAFRRALATEGVTAKAMTGAGIAAAQQGHLSAARHYLERALLLEPDSIDVNNNLGVVLYGLGEYRAAQRAFQTAFIVSSGTSAIAGMNLRLSEEAVAADGLAPPLDPAVAFEVRRLGGSEFRLEALRDETLAERGVAAADAPGDAEEAAGGLREAAIPGDGAPGEATGREDALPEETAAEAPPADETAQDATAEGVPAAGTVAPDAADGQADPSRRIAGELPATGATNGAGEPG